MTFFLKIVLRVAVLALALLAIARLVPGISITSLPTALLVAVLWGIIGVTIKPFIQLLALPITILTLGLFALLINAAFFWLIAASVPGFSVAGFLPALEGSVLLALINWIVHSAL